MNVNIANIMNDMHILPISINAYQMMILKKQDYMAALMLYILQKQKNMSVYRVKAILFR